MKKLFAVKNLDSKVSLGLLLLRVVIGAAMMAHGWGKIQNPFSWMPPEAGIPGILQALAALSEFGGGLAWILGLLTPLASLGMAFTMAVAVAVHVGKGDPFVGMSGSYEPALVYLTVSIALILMTPGKFSLDRKLFGTR